MGLNKYGELTEDEAKSGSFQTSQKSVSEKRCDICLGSLDVIHSICLTCNDGRAYCSSRCFERHQRNEHHEENFCAQCDGKINKTYFYSDRINNAFFPKHRFCCEHCLDVFRDTQFCEECGDKLPSTYYYDNKISSILHRQVRFCTEYCIKKYRRERFCYACGGKLGNTYRYCTICGEDQYRFCNVICSTAHNIANH